MNGQLTVKRTNYDFSVWTDNLLQDGWTIITVDGRTLVTGDGGTMITVDGLAIYCCTYGLQLQ